MVPRSMRTAPWRQRAAVLLAICTIVSLSSAPHSSAQVTEGAASGGAVSEEADEQPAANGGSDSATGDALQTPLDKVLAGYMSNEDMEAHLHDYVRRCGAISQLRSLGKSAGGRTMWALVLGAGLDGDLPAPAFRYVGNMHGDEPTGRPLLLALAEWLCTRRGSDESAARILSSMQLHLLPSMNPDGFADHGRGNGNEKDLNRDFPHVIDPDSGQHMKGPLDPTGSEQPETAALIAYARSQPFVASASMHEGALVANYPWDANDRGQRGYAASPDNAAFKVLAKAYAEAHAGGMLEDPEFAGKGGITNGAEWYEVYGSMQDWSYVDSHCMEITLELSPQKWPPEATLGNLFAANLPAMLALPLTAAFGGLRGFVVSQSGSAPLQAIVSVEGIDSFVLSSTAFGDYYRSLAPGQYTIQVAVDGFANASAAVTVPSDGSGTQHNFTLTPLATGGSSSGGGEKGRQSGVEGVAVDAAAGVATASGQEAVSMKRDRSTVGEDSWLARRGGAGFGPVRSSGGSGGISYRSAVWAAVALAVLLVVVWAVRKRRRRRRLWARD